MKYETTPHKIRKVWVDSKTNEIKINRIAGTNLRIKEKINNTSQLGFKRILELSTDWETPELTDDNTFYIEWEIVFNSFPVKLMPYVNYNVVYKHPQYSGIDEILNDNINYNRTNCIFKVENLEENEDNEEVKKVTMIISHKLQLVDEEDYYNVQCKLFLNLYNPESYI
jgi:hypothetical protein